MKRHSADDKSDTTAAPMCVGAGTVGEPSVPDGESGGEVELCAASCRVRVHR